MTDRSYLWHLEQAAIAEQIADRHARRGLYQDAQEAREQAQKHRDQAMAIDLERRAAA